MKKMRMAFVAAISMTVFFVSCQKDVKTTDSDVSQDELNKIASMGFSTSGVTKQGDGFLVEGDIFIPTNDLGKTSNSPNLLVASEEQYRTTNLVTVSGGARNITVSINTSDSYFVQALDEAIRRYNAEGLQLTFTRITGTADINVQTYYQNSNTLGYAGFPTGGNPYNTISMNTYWYNANTNINYLATIISHEMGHCIGFRHTDYMSRKFSCGPGPGNNEGASTVGAIHIPGTPTGPDAASWMLACVGGGVNRPFNANDKIALNYLY